MDNTFDLSIELPKKFVHSNETFLDNYMSTLKTSVSSMPTPNTDGTLRVKRKSLKDYHYETPNTSYLDVQRRVRNLVSKNGSESSENYLYRNYDVYCRSRLARKPPRQDHSNSKIDLINTPVRYPRLEKKNLMKQNLSKQNKI